MFYYYLDELRLGSVNCNPEQARNTSYLPSWMSFEGLKHCEFINYSVR
jgi:hypothetical protein